MADSAKQQSYAIQLKDVRSAAERISGHVHRTPVMTCSTLDATAGVSLFFKAENFQKSGSFKIRGASNAIFSLTPEDAANGVVTHSSGNHAAAVALAAKMRGNTPAHILVPRNTPSCKVDAVKAYGGTLYFCEPTMEARELECAKVQAQTGSTFIHPYNMEKVMAGQGTMALELLEQVPDGLDAVVVPISGGGMISGVTIASKSLNPSIRIIAAEPCGTNDGADVAKAKHAGQLVPCERPKTIADGLQGRLGDKTWPIVRDLVDEVIVVSEAEIVNAMKLIYERLKVVVEPSGAAGLAAVLSPSFQSSSALQGCARVGIILCGGNVDLPAKGVWAPELWQPAV